MPLERRRKAVPGVGRPAPAVPDLDADEGSIAVSTMRAALVNLGLGPQEVQATLDRYARQVLRTAAQRVAALPATDDGLWITAARREVLDALLPADGPPSPGAS